MLFGWEGGIGDSTGAVAGVNGGGVPLVVGNVDGVMGVPVGVEGTSILVVVAVRCTRVAVNVGDISVIGVVLGVVEDGGLPGVPEAAGVAGLTEPVGVIIGDGEGERPIVIVAVAEERGVLTDVVGVKVPRVDEGNTVLAVADGEPEVAVVEGVEKGVVGMFEIVAVLVVTGNGVPGPSEAVGVLADAEVGVEVARVLVDEGVAAVIAEREGLGLVVPEGVASADAVAV